MENKKEILVQKSESKNNSFSSTSNYAGFWRRFLALSVDTLIISLIGVGISFSLGTDPLAETKSNLQTIDRVLTWVMTISYSVLFWVNYDGATPGKRLMAIKIVNVDGKPINYGVAIIRNLGYLISAVPLGLGYLWVAWDKKKQGWHDKIAHTYVVKTDKSPRIGLAIFLTLLLVIGCIVIGILGVIQLPEIKQSLNKNYNSYQLEKDDKDKILSFAPSNCGISVPVPTFTSDLNGKKLSWSFNEQTLAPSSFYVIENNKLNVSVTDLRFKAVDEKEDYGNIWLYCVDNTKNLNLKEYESLVLLNKKYPATTEKEGKLGELKVIPVTLSGANVGGSQPSDENGYIGLSRDGAKLVYIFFSYAPSHAFSANVEEDINLMQNNLNYR